MTNPIQSRPVSSASDVNSLEFYLTQFLNKVWTSTIVKVMSVTNDGGVSPVGRVSIQPLVNQIDSTGKLLAHGTVHDAPYFRLAGGSDAVILDPKVGDIGVALFASRDISVVKNEKRESAPGSARKFSASDAIYIGVVLNGSPSQYIRFSAAGIEMVSPTKIALQAPIVEVSSQSIILDGPLSQGAGSNAGNAHFTNKVTSDDDVVAGTVSLKEHKTGGVEPGSGTSGPPVQ
jgi:hypothetical protein